VFFGDVFLIYPKINLAIGYEVDAGWPQRPKDLVWGHVPGVAVDGEDNVWLHTRAEVPVQVYSADGRFIRAWGKGMVKRPHHIKIGPEGNVWLTDEGRHVVWKCTREGEVLMTLGVLDKPGCDETHLNGPTDVAFGPQGDIFVSDGYGNNRVVHFDGDGKFINAWGELGVGQGQFSLPHCIGVDSAGRVYVGGRNNVRVQVFDSEGNFLDEWRNLIVPWGICVMPADEIWVVGSSPMRWEEDKDQLGGPPKDQILMKFNPEGKVLQLWTVPVCPEDDVKPGECFFLHGVALDSEGNIYTGEVLGRRAQKFVRIESDA
jgi:hypothetical protein